MAASISTESQRGRAGKRGVISLKLRELDQLFNKMDPAPFHEKDLDQDAEEFIVSWAEEFHKRQPLELVLHLERPPAEPDAVQMLRQALRNYFSYRADLSRLEFRRLIGRGRMSLVIGSLVLVLAGIAANLVRGMGDAAMYRIAGEGLIIGGWVAMWRPMEIFLYEWWPIARRRRLFQRLAEMTVTIRGG